MQFLEYRDEPATGPAPTPQRGVPANVEAERAVLGSILLDAEALFKIGTKLAPGDFFRERHGWIYEAMLVLSDRREPIDFVTLTEQLERQGQLAEAGGPAYLTSLVADIPTSIYVEHYADIVATAASRRRLMAVAGQIAELAHDESGEIAQAIDQAEQLVFGVAERQVQRDFEPVRSIISEALTNIEAQGKGAGVGIPSGFKMLDRVLGGFQKSDLIILAARPAMGKTSLCLSWAQNAIQTGKRVAFFSLEMSNEQLARRLLSMTTGIDGHRLRMGSVHEEEWPIMLEAANALAESSLFIDDTPAASVADIRTKCRRLHAKHEIDMVIIDYMQLMTGGGKSENRTQEISHISRSLKALARELNVPVIALSQLSRGVESRADKRPMLSDLRESGSIEQDADAVLFIYREDYYIENTDRQNIADILVAKHRHGATGTVSLFFRKELTQFRDLGLTRTALNHD